MPRMLAAVRVWRPCLRFALVALGLALGGMFGFFALLSVVREVTMAFSPELHHWSDAPSGIEVVIVPVVAAAGAALAVFFALRAARWSRLAPRRDGAAAVRVRVLSLATPPLLVSCWLLLFGVMAVPPSWFPYPECGSGSWLGQTASTGCWQALAEPEGCWVWRERHAMPYLNPVVGRVTWSGACMDRRAAGDGALDILAGGLGHPVWDDRWLPVRREVGSLVMGRKVGLWREDALSGQSVSGLDERGTYARGTRHGTWRMAAATGCAFFLHYRYGRFVEWAGRSAGCPDPG